MDTFQENLANTEGACSATDGPSQGYHMNNGINISDEIEKYLDNLSSKDVDFIDPKLKREREKLQDLLTSYKKLSEKLDRKCAEASKQGIHVPTREILARRAEIYALLHPELYKNRSEEEKKKLIEKISSRRHFSEVDKVCPKDITPIHSVSDKRQQEKDRFCKLVASAPSRFHNVLGEPTSRFKRLTRPPSTPPCHVDVRENEKDRLARIFATSAAFIRDPNLKKKILQKCREANRPSHQNTTNNSHPPLTLNAEPDMCQRAHQVPARDNTVSELTPNLHEMVRIGEYSPLNKYSSPSQGRTFLGVGEHDEKRKQLSEERRYEYLNYREQENHTKVDKGVMVSTPSGRRSVSSISTQTDEPDPQVESPTQVDHFKMVSSPREFVDYSPREKLLSDLYGFRPSSDAVQEEKSKRIAYAQALQEQIKEKKRLEDERKRREKEEEELEERRYREQAERIQKEYDHERNLKLDFVIQRQAQEELLRKRLAEMNLEAKELKKKERLSRLNNGDESPDVSVSNHPDLASAYSSLQALENGGRILDREVAGAASAAALQERLPDANFEEDWSRIAELEGVDLLREHRSQKERLQLPPVVDATTKIDRRKPRSSERAPATGYVPSSVNDTMRRTQNYRQQADAILRAPIDEEIAHAEGTAQRSAVSLPPPLRSRSPVLPAVRTGSMLKRNSRILDDKWKVPQGGSHDLGRTIVDKGNILTQLGAFRRQLAQEHHKLEERIRGQSSS